MLDTVAKLATFLNREKKFNYICVGERKQNKNFLNKVRQIHPGCEIKSVSERKFLQIANSDVQGETVVVYFLHKAKHGLSIKNLKIISDISKKTPFLVYVESDSVNKKRFLGKILQKRNKEIASLYKHLESVQIKGLVNPNDLGNKYRIYIDGRLARFRKVAKKLKVLAVITQYNERDIIEQNIKYLLSQGIDVHIVDNWSNDGSYEKVKRLQKRFKRISLERYPKKKPKYYEWKKILKRVESIANNSNYGWIIHYDSDEFRESPWRNATLYDGIKFVDSCGYNALDFTVLNYRFTKTTSRFSETKNPLTYFKYCEFGNHPAHFIQVKTWKNIKKVTLWESGGHNASFDGVSTFPIKFLINHYPLRSPRQAQKKLFSDRFPRFSPRELKKGWHSHYNIYKKIKKIAFSEDGLIEGRNEKFYRDYMVELISGIGIKKKP